MLPRSERYGWTREAVSALFDVHGYQVLNQGLFSEYNIILFRDFIESLQIGSDLLRSRHPIRNSNSCDSRRNRISQTRTLTRATSSSSRTKGIHLNGRRSA